MKTYALAALALAALMCLSFVARPVQADVLPTQQWQDYYPFRIQFSFPQGGTVGDSFSAAHGSSAASAYHGLDYAGFVANATDDFTYSMNITWSVPVSGTIYVTVTSYDFPKSFAVPIDNQTYMAFAFVFSLTPAPEIPTPQQYVDACTQGFTSIFTQNNNVLYRILTTLTTDVYAIAVGVIGAIFGVGATAVLVIQRRKK